VATPWAGNEEAFAGGHDGLSERSGLRCAIGRANREKAAADYGETRKIARYASLDGEAIGRPDTFMAAE
jgi:hypothetical protein